MPPVAAAPAFACAGGGHVTTLVGMAAASFGRYRDAAAKGYAGDNVAAGRWPAAGALERAYEDFDASLPLGLATPDHFLHDIVDETTNTRVGVLWFAAIEKNGIASAYVYDIEIAAGHRRRGHARAAFAALESLVRARGLERIGLHVFSHNPAAQALYRSLGYEVTGVNMQKALRTGDA